MKIARVTLLFVFAMCFGAAFGAEALTATEWTAPAPHITPDWLIAVAHLVSDVLPIVAAPLLLLVAWAAHKLAVKLHLDGVINEQALVTDFSKKGFLFAEQWAAKQTSTPPGSEKMKVAINFADSLLQNKNVQSYGAEHLEKIIEGLVGEANTTAENAAPTPAGT